MRLLVQQFLETHSFKEIQEQHGVYASFSKSGHKFSLNYDQIEARESDPLSQETRGLILSAEDGHSFTAQAVIVNGRLNYDAISPGKTKILAYPIKRFFNHGQGSAANIDWSDPKLAVLEKLDGTLVIVYWDPFTKQWCAATRSVPEADLLMDNGLYTFRTLFEKALTETTGYDFNLGFKYLLDDAHTYCFELTTPYNRVVVEYPKSGITLLAVRNLVTLNELAFDHPVVEMLMPRVPIVQAHTYTSVQELVDWVSSLNPMEHEGVVVRDGQFNRIKVKNAAYVAASKIKEALATSPRNCLELILLGKDDDAAPFLPQEIQDNLLSLKEKFVLWLRGQEVLTQTIIAEARAIGADKKTFALTVQKHKPDVPAALFAIYNNKADSIKSFIDHNRKDGTWSNSFIDNILSVI